MSNVKTHHPMDESYDESYDSLSFYTKSLSEDLYARGPTQNENEKNGWTFGNNIYKGLFLEVRWEGGNEISSSKNLVSDHICLLRNKFVLFSFDLLSVAFLVVFSGLKEAID